MSAVAQGEKRDFLPDQPLFDHDPFSGSAENPALHRVVNGFERRLRVVADRHALARRKAVGLDHHRSALTANMGARGLDIVEHRKGCGRHARFPHYLLGERFAGFELSGGL